MLRTSKEEEEGYNMVPPAELRPLNSLREQIASSEMNDQYKVLIALSSLREWTLMGNWPGTTGDARVG
jgi:hypothetical protein